MAQRFCGTCLSSTANTTLNSTISTMRRGKRLSADLQQVIMNSLQSRQPEAVAKLVQVHRSSVYRVAAKVAQQGHIPSPSKRPRGAFKSLSDAEIRVGAAFVPLVSADISRSTS
jgi:transposase